jgi:conjugative transfer region protein TrbK
MRGFPLNMGCLGRAFGFVAVAALLVAAILHERTDAIRPVLHLRTPASAPNDPLTRELARCQAIGSTANNDAHCEAAWAENRRRFFTYPSLGPATPSSHATPQPNPTSTGR